MSVESIGLRVTTHGVFPFFCRSVVVIYLWCVSKLLGSFNEVLNVVRAVDCHDAYRHVVQHLHHMFLSSLETTEALKSSSKNFFVVVLIDFLSWLDGIAAIRSSRSS